MTGTTGCFTVMVPLTLQGNESHVQRISLLAVGPFPAIYSGVILQAGRYEAEAKVVTTEFRLRSEPLTFVVR